MKRDMDLARQILIQVEDSPAPFFPVRLNIEGKSQEEIVYHVVLLEEAGWIEATDVGDDWRLPTRLTWQGCEFLESVKDNTRWKEVKEVTEKIGGFVVQAMMPTIIEAIKVQARSLLGIP